MPPFAFKRFSLQHENSSMKVGTDGVLLGAWTQLPERGEDYPILEVGCGCGLVSLMLAQRLSVREGEGWSPIRAVDIHSASCIEAAGNVARSPFENCVEVEQADFLHLPPSYEEGSFGLIVSNPPFFSHALKSPDKRRNMARHNDSLPFGALVREAKRLLFTGGRLALVLSPEAFYEVSSCMCMEHRIWRPRRITRVFSRPGKPCERILCEWEKTEKTVSVCENTLFIYRQDGSYDENYRNLVREFYLWA